MDSNSASRWAMVTGSSSGIGRATALLLASRGWDVAVHCHRSLDAAQEVAHQIGLARRSSVIVRADFADPAQCHDAVRQAWDQTGGFHAWVHVAGADLLTGAGREMTYEEKLERATAVDLWGTMVTCREVGARMQSQGTGAIVTIGWDQANSGMEGDSGEIFAAVKGGVMAFSRSLAKTLAPLVRVNCVAPGWIKTAWGEQASATWQERVRRETPLRRWGTVDDVAKTIAFLISDEAAFLTGQTIAVNGGAVTS